MSTTVVTTERSSRRKTNNNDSNQEKNESINNQSNVNNGSGGVKRANKRKSTTNAVRMRQEQNNNTTNTNDHTNKNVQFVESDSKKPKLDTKTEMFEKYQPWVIKTYGDLSKTKTVTIRKYSRILKTLRGEEVNSADSSKFRFWVKAKGFHVGRPDGYDAKPADTIVGRYSVCDFDDAGQNELIESQVQQKYDQICGSAKDPPLYVPTVPVKNATPVGGEPVYRKVAVVENFFDIIYSVHVELEGRPGKHAGQKRTYRTITETYAFLPREAVTRFLLGCTDCQRRPRSLSPASKLQTSPADGLPSSDVRERVNVTKDIITGGEVEDGSDVVQNAGCYLADKANTSTFDDKRINFGSVASFVNDGDGTAQVNAVVSSTVMQCADTELDNGDSSSDKSKKLAAVDLTSKDTTKSNSTAKTSAEQITQNSGYFNNNAKYIFPYFPLCNFSANNDYQKTFEKSLLQNQNNFKVISDQVTFDKDVKFKNTNPVEPKKKSSNPLDVCNLTSKDPPKKSNLKKFLPMMNGNFGQSVKQETVFTDFTKPWSPISRIYPNDSVNKNGQLSEMSKGVSIFASMAASKKVSDIKQDPENSQDNNTPCKFEPVDFNQSPSSSRSSDFRMLGGEIDYSLPITTTYLKHMRSLGYSDEEALKLERSENMSTPEPAEVQDEEHYNPGAIMKDGDKLKLMLLAWNYHNQAVAGGRNGAEGMPELPGVNAEDMAGLWASYHSALGLGKGKATPPVIPREQSSPVLAETGSAHDETSSSGNKEDEDDEDDESDDRIDTQTHDPERLKAFNMFVRLFVDENLDRMVPISKQPKEKIQAIIDSCTRQFPEFAERARKRIRTYLKSCRRNKRARDPSTPWDATRPTPAHLTSVQAEQILATACENESHNAKRMRLGLEPVSQPMPVLPGVTPMDTTAPVSTNRIDFTPTSNSIKLETTETTPSVVFPSSTTPTSTPTPVSKATGLSLVSEAKPQGLCVTPTNLVTSAASMNGISGTTSSAGGAAPTALYRPNFTQAFQRAGPYPTNPLFPGQPFNVSGTTGIIGNGPTDLSMKQKPVISHKLSTGEMAAVRQLITGYRESAAFLLRSADELEQLLLQQQ